MVTYAECGKKTANDFLRVSRLLFSNKLSRVLLLMTFGMLMIYIGISHSSVAFVLIGLLGIASLVLPVFVMQVLGVGLLSALIVYLFI